MLSMDDAQKLAALLSNNSLSFCTCWVCTRDYARELQQAFPELQWGYEEKADQSNEGIVTVTVPASETGT